MPGTLLCHIEERACLMPLGFPCTYFCGEDSSVSLCM